MRRLDLPVDRIKTLYAIGVPVSRIAAEVGTVRERVKRIVRREKLNREPARYAEGVGYLAEFGESFVETDSPGYWVSDRGRVVAMGEKPGTFLKPEVDKDGYHRVNLWVQGCPSHHLIHRLVLLAFHGLPAEGELAAHNNGVRSDNRTNNLRWATQTENCADKVIHGTQTRGSESPNAIIDEVAAARIKAAFRGGATIKQAATEGGSSFWIAADIKRGKTWRHVA